jgi:lipid-binding SYLF domain-containing protein
VLEELLAGEESIPRDLLDEAECVAVIPSVKAFALGFGGRFGKGAVLCRTPDGRFGPPLMISIGGGSFGPQIGGQAADFVFLIMNPKGIDSLIRSRRSSRRVSTPRWRRARWAAPERPAPTCG